MIFLSCVFIVKLMYKRIFCFIQVDLELFCTEYVHVRYAPFF